MTKYTFDPDLLSDIHKDAYGVRPSHFFWDMWREADDAEKQAIYDGLIETVNAEIRREQEAQQLAIEEYELRLCELMNCGALDRNMAIRWMLESLDDEYVYIDMGLGCYKLGLPYSYAKELQAAVDEA